MTTSDEKPKPTKRKSSKPSAAKPASASAARSRVGWGKTKPGVAPKLDEKSRLNIGGDVRQVRLESAHRDAQQKVDEAEAEDRVTPVTLAVRQELAGRELARKKLLGLVLRHEPNYMVGWVHRDIAARLEQFVQDVADKKSPRLVLEVPPRHGKSLLASQYLPSWVLGHYPSWEVIITSHTGTLAEKFSRKVREIVRDPKYLKVFAETVPDPQSQSVTNWLTTKGGGVLAAGVGGGILGSGAHCFPAGTLVETPNGKVPIERLQPHMSVSTLNLATGRLVAAQIERVKAHDTQDRLVEVGTDAGRRIRATADHCFYVAGVGWVEARHLQAADPLVVPQIPPSVRAVRGRDGGAVGGAAEVAEEGAQGPVLQRCLPGQVTAEGLAVRDTPGHGRSTVAEREVLPEWLRLPTEPEELRAEVLSTVRDGVPASLASDAVLLARLRERGSFGTDGGSWQQSLQRWHELRALVRHDEDAHLGAGWWLRGLRGRGASPYPPRGPQPEEQRAGELNRDVPRAPHDTPQVEIDAVSVVELCGTGAERVYDLRVEGTHSFIAGEVLVHNCLIIDDPIKNSEEGTSDSTKAAVWEWYATTARTRLAPGGGVLVIMQRWAKNDLAGMLIARGESEEGERFEVVHYPAIAEEDEQYRKKGEALHPERYDLKALEAIRTTLDPWMWSALYQQRPTLEDGDYFTRDMVSLYEKHELPKELTHYAAWDLAISKKERADWTVGLVAGLDAHGDLWLLERWRGHWDSAEICDRILDCWEDFKPDLMGAEQGQIKLALGPYLERSAEDRELWDFQLEELKPGRRDKVLRARSIQGLMRRKKVHFPKYASWMNGPDGLIAELMAFPNGDHDDQCVAEGTLVATPDGPRPIEGIRAGDEVLTPAGPRRVLAAECTGVKPVYELRVGEQTLVATGNHPVHSPSRGWARMDALAYMDDISCLNESCTTALSGTATPTRHSRVIAVISNAMRGIGSILSTCIGTSGNRLMDRYPRTALYTTGITTPAITSSTTSSFSLPKHTESTTRPSDGASARISSASILRGFGRWLRSGIEALRAGPGTSSTAVGTGSAGSCTPRSAPSAGPLSRLRSPIGASSAGALARRVIGGVVDRLSRALRSLRGRKSDGPTPRWSRSPAWSAARISAPSTPRWPGTAASAAVEPRSVQGLRRLSVHWRVYNLTVEGEHVYYANGVLTHNCDALAYLGLMLQDMSHIKREKKERSPAPRARAWESQLVQMLREASTGAKSWRAA